MTRASICKAIGPLHQVPALREKANSHIRYFRLPVLGDVSVRLGQMADSSCFGTVGLNDFEH